MIKFRKDEFSRPLIYSTNDEYETGCHVTEEVVNDIKQLQSTLEEIREYINYNDDTLYTYEPDYDYEENIVDNYDVSSYREDLLQIIDKGE